MISIWGIAISVLGVQMLGAVVDVIREEDLARRVASLMVFVIELIAMCILISIGMGEGYV